MYWLSNIIELQNQYSIDDIVPFMYQQKDKDDFLSMINLDDLNDSNVLSFTKNAVQSKEISSINLNNSRNPQILPDFRKLLYASKCQDCLFWSIYIAVYGFTEFRRISYSKGNKEIEEKTKIAQNFHKNGKANSQFLTIKMTKTQSGAIAENILTKPTTEYQLLYAYCVFYKCNIYIVDLTKKIFLQYLYNNSDSPNYILYKNPYGNFPKYYIDIKEDVYTIAQLNEQFLKAENHEKALKTISKYKITDLEQIAETLSLTRNEKEKKQNLYDRILTYCVWK